MPRYLPSGVDLHAQGRGGAAAWAWDFIISLPFTRDRRASRVLVSLLKRWPRLACLIVITCLLSCVTKPFTRWAPPVRMEHA